MNSDDKADMMSRFYRLPEKRIRDHIYRMNARKKCSSSGYETLLEPYLGEYEILRHRDYVREAEIGDRKVLLVRHDVDHDHITAQKIAKWEYNHDIRATYCLLHTAWYYGELDGKSYVHTHDLIDCAKFLIDLGHEVAFHNNLVALALYKPIDPVALLKRELEFFRSNGVDIVGTSTHGDKLCTKLKFRNWELFIECCDDRFGGPRTIAWQGGNGMQRIQLGKVSMFDFDLEYEAYDIAIDTYHTDSGGNMNTHRCTSGRRPFGRKDPEKGSVVGILAHPLWWRFD